MLEASVDCGEADFLVPLRRVVEFTPTVNLTIISQSASQIVPGGDLHKLQPRRWGGLLTLIIAPANESAVRRERARVIIADGQR